MPYARGLLLLAALAAISACKVRDEQPGTVSSGNTSIYFSPGGGCTKAIVKTVDGARKNILVQAYSFTSAPIARALVAAKRRGVDVRIILDRSQHGDGYSSADFLAHNDIPVWIDEAHAIAHNKVMVIDQATVITGSFNFTRAAEQKNAENLLVIKDKILAAIYTRNWVKHVHHSVIYQRK